MSAISGTIQAVHLLGATVGEGGARKIYSVIVDVADSYTGSTDTFALADVGATILAANANGKTHTLRWAAPGHPGIDTNGQAIYACGGTSTVQPLVVSSDALTGVLGSAANAKVTTSTATKGIEIIVAVDES